MKETTQDCQEQRTYPEGVFYTAYFMTLLQLA
jgi:hypothetical protein